MPQNLPSSAKPSQEQFLAAIRRIETLSPAPVVLRRAIALLADPNSDVSSVVDLIKVDPALTADVIRGANSAFFGAGECVSSLDRAVEKIGFRESIRLLNVSVAHMLAARDLSSYGIPDDVFWAESLFHGLFIEELARVTGAADPDSAHTAGLLRFVGRLAINQTIGNLGAGLFWDGMKPLPQWEIEEVGFSQAVAAGALLRAWHFPEELCSALEHQTEPERAAEGNWFAPALHFAGQVLPEGFAPIVIAPANLTVPSTTFTLQFGLTASVTRELVSATRERFNAVNHGLYD